ncbi:hypothetical protein AVU67_gp03 [Ralstonia phage RSJ2]|uniref:Uncharacterized protein n=1 Tax=Ralstonia phage RSJ2 TaxID=1481785 RepID=A0A068Q7T5_9CAUD|nr:hypothetical protein AVU67_gp03 [Ralstonia phage RSJ2]BAP15809.1 hypothetical protein [Ralstonia phage RSJ2]
MWTRAARFSLRPTARQATCAAWSVLLCWASLPRPIICTHCPAMHRCRMFSCTSLTSTGTCDRNTHRLETELAMTAKLFLVLCVVLAMVYVATSAMDSAATHLIGHGYIKA